MVISFVSNLIEMDITVVHRKSSCLHLKKRNAVSCSYSGVPVFEFRPGD